MLHYLFNVFIMLPLLTLDRALNALFGPVFNLWLPEGSLHRFGDPGETISSVLGKNYPACRVCVFICRLLNHALGPEHCQSSVDPVEGSRQDGEL